MYLREAPVELPVEPEDAGGRVAPVAAGMAAVERLQRAAQQEDCSSPGQPLPPKRPFRAPSVPSLCALATRATVHLMTGVRPCTILQFTEQDLQICFNAFCLLHQLPVCSTAAVWPA